MQSSFTSKMYCDQNNDWTYLPVETADEVMSCGEMIECASLANWNRWLKIRKRQHRRLGLMVTVDKRVYCYHIGGTHECCIVGMS